MTNQINYISLAAVSPQNGMTQENFFIQTLIGRVLADDTYIGPRRIAVQNQDESLS